MMPIVNADVIDIRRYVPSAGEACIVDTNVWKWIAYTKLTLPAAAPPQARHYPAFISLARAKRMKLLHSGLSLSELSNIVERDEFRQYAATAGISSDDRERKRFRRDPFERAKVTAEIDAAWQQVQALSDLAPVTIDVPTTDSCLKHLTTCAVDAYDGFLVETALKAGVPRILTDDVDLCNVPGIVVLTSHPVVINAAARAKKLKA